VLKFATGSAHQLLQPTCPFSPTSSPSSSLHCNDQWIVNATTEARVVHLGLRGSVPSDGDTTAKFYAPKELAVKTAYCFVAAMADDKTNGPSGVVCSSEDFRGVFTGNCVEKRLPYSFYKFDYTRSGRVERSYLTCQIQTRNWVRDEELGPMSPFNNITLGFGATPVRMLCPVGSIHTPSTLEANDGPECGLYIDGDPDNFASFYKNIYPDVMSFLPQRSCPASAGVFGGAPMSACLSPGSRISYPFWDPTSFAAGGNGAPDQPVPPPLALHRLPALRLADVEPANPKNGPCRAIWDPAVPVRCGADKKRYMVANLGPNGPGDTTSWPALGGANNQTTRTTAVVDVLSGPDGGAAFRCLPVWLRADGSVPQSAALTPVPTSVVITQSAGPVYAGDEKFAWASSAVETLVVEGPGLASVLGAYPSVDSMPTAYNRYLPRVVTCAVEASDPENDGSPVYARGAYLAVRNAAAPNGIELRPFSFPAP